MLPPPLAVRLVPDFVPDPASLWEQATSELLWDDRIRARRTASVGIAYNYSGIWYPDVPMPDFISTLATRVAALVAHPITNCLANFYPTGESKMGFHADAAEGIVPGTSTSILSLGARRPLVFKPKSGGDARPEFALDPGSLLIMDASVQDHWLHALPPSRARVHA
ncbi:Alkylated DNA repair protein [Minicystis rosea]|nr:Alkylated DNA repair protein [Minicystis rosea]